MICSTCGRDGWHTNWCSVGLGPPPRSEPGIGFGRVESYTQVGALGAAATAVAEMTEEPQPVGPPDARGLRYLLELNGKERSLLPEDLQQIYEWHGVPMKWVMRENYRAEFCKEYAS